VIGTASQGTFEFLRQLGVQPVAYGPGLADRVRALAPDGVTAATDLFGTRRPRPRSEYCRNGSPRSPPAPPSRRRPRHRRQRSRAGRPGADHRRDPRRQDHRARQWPDIRRHGPRTATGPIHLTNQLPCIRILTRPTRFCMRLWVLRKRDGLPAQVTDPKDVVAQRHNEYGAVKDGLRSSTESRGNRCQTVSLPLHRPRELRHGARWSRDVVPLLIVCGGGKQR
jgi:hypothetical protein